MSAFHKATDCNGSNSAIENVKAFQNLLRGVLTQSTSPSIAGGEISAVRTIRLLDGLGRSNLLQSNS
jgi:hypothetical protein